MEDFDKDSLTRISDAVETSLRAQHERLENARQTAAESVAIQEERFAQAQDFSEMVGRIVERCSHLDQERERLETELGAAIERGDSLAKDVEDGKSYIANIIAQHDADFESMRKAHADETIRIERAHERTVESMKADVVAYHEETEARHANEIAEVKKAAERSIADLQDHAERAIGKAKGESAELRMVLERKNMETDLLVQAFDVLFSAVGKNNSTAREQVADIQALMDSLRGQLPSRVEVDAQATSGEDVPVEEAPVVSRDNVYKIHAG